VRCIDAKRGRALPLLLRVLVAVWSVFSPLQGFKVCSIGDGLGLFERGGNKYRCCHMIDQLAANATLFTQVAYASLVNPDGALSDDGKLRFIFCTLPAMFNFCFDQVGRQRGVEFVESLFRLHRFLHTVF
jgi:hypothetical protein